MFIGREKELGILNSLYKESGFQYLVMYGRRRIGKTELLKEFSKDKKVIFYSAIEDKNNLDYFSDEVLSYFEETSKIRFENWNEIFNYIYEHSKDDSRTLIIIDEFPYIAKYEPNVKSFLQHAIDRKWKEKSIMLVLCGSSVSFMTNGVMGKKSPLYGRNTCVMEVLPFDYTITRYFYPNYSCEDRIRAYSILGGVPYYLSIFKDSKSIEENISDYIISSNAALREEAITLLKSELREPATYNSILEAIASGNNKLTEISEKTKIDSTKLPVYLNTLLEMRLVEKIKCCGEKKSTKKTQYVIKDNFFSFWYKFVFSKQTKIELMNSDDYSREISNELSTYTGYKFERICYQYIVNTAKKGNLPFIPDDLGKWWGTNSLTKEQDDIDILGIEKDKYIFCECKFKNEIFDLKDFNKLLTSSKLFKNAREKYYYIFVKRDATDSVKEKAREYNCTIINVDELFLN